jgi:hypothetical protein
MNFDWELILSTGENSIDEKSILSGGKGNPLAALGTANKELGRRRLNEPASRAVS